MRTLITDWAGFVGSHLSDHFLKEGNEVIAIDSFLTGNRDNIAHLLNNPLHNKVTEIGQLEIWCHSRDGKQRWKLEFNVREGK